MRADLSLERMYRGHKKVGNKKSRVNLMVFDLEKIIKLGTPKIYSTIPSTFLQSCQILIVTLLLN